MTLELLRHRVKRVSDIGRIPFPGYVWPPPYNRSTSHMLGGASDYTSCPDCGTSVGSAILEADLHRCDSRHRDEHVARLAFARSERFELDFRTYLATPQGRFAVFYAAHTRAR